MFFFFKKKKYTQIFNKDHKYLCSYKSAFFMVLKAVYNSTQCQHLRPKQFCAILWKPWTLLKVVRLFFLTIICSSSSHSISSWLAFKHSAPSPWQLQSFIQSPNDVTQLRYAAWEDLVIFSEDTSDPTGAGAANHKIHLDMALVQRVSL